MIDPIWDANRVPDGFWAEKKNRKAYMDWLGKRLGYKKITDWYKIDKSTFYANRGGGLLANYFCDSPQAAVREYKPNYKWKDWLFPSTRQGFWKKKENRVEYLKWLGKHLGFKKMEDWYNIDQKSLINNRGAALLHSQYGGSVIRAVRELHPDYPWKEWLFHSVPQGFWKKPKNHKVYLTWLGDTLGFKDPWDWARLSKRHFRENGGAGLLAMYYRDSPLMVLKRHKRGHNWKKMRAPLVAGQRSLFADRA